MKDSRKEIISKTLAAQEGNLSETEFSDFESHLLENEDARAIYLQCTQMQAALETLPPDVNEVAIEKTTRPLPFTKLSATSIGIALASAAAIVLAVFVGSLLPEKAPPHSSLVATLLLAEECEWSHPRNGLIEGQRLRPGKLALNAGTALLRFDSGAELVMSGKTDLKILSPDSGRLEYGEVVIRAEDGAEGFRLETPGGEMTDLGTEFAVRVHEGGETELHVHEGEVAASGSIVAAGKAVSMHKGDAAGADELPFGAPNFRDVIRKANPKERRDLMTAYEGFNVAEGIYTTDTMISGKGWTTPWRLRKPEELGDHAIDTIPDMIISHGQMNVPWPVRGGEAGMLQFPPGMNIRIRQMKKPIDFSENKITYFSFLAAEEPNRKLKKQNKSKREDFRITFRSSEDYFGESLSIGWNQKRQLRAQINPSTAQQSIRKIPAGETVFVVGKFTHSERDFDEMKFRFYRTSDTLDFTEPAVWDVTYSGFRLDAKLDLLLITSKGSATRYADELRIGPTWRSVTPIDFEKIDND